MIAVMTLPPPYLRLCVHHAARTKRTSLREYSKSIGHLNKQEGDAADITL
jgi:hypothetical protein